MHIPYAEWIVRDHTRPGPGRATAVDSLAADGASQAIRDRLLRAADRGGRCIAHRRLRAADPAPLRADRIDRAGDADGRDHARRRPRAFAPPYRLGADDHRPEWALVLPAAYLPFVLRDGLPREPRHGPAAERVAGLCRPARRRLHLHGLHLVGHRRVARPR